MTKILNVKRLVFTVYQIIMFEVPGRSNSFYKSKVSFIRDGVYRISGIEAGEDPTDKLVELSIKEGWGLYELMGAQASVEEVFVELTKQEEEET